jgi:hypothetical protein
VTTKADFDRLIRRAMTEKQWDARVVALARLYGFWTFHPYDSRRSEPGWPDRAFVKPPRFFLAEMKTERGRLTVQQQEVIGLLRACGVTVYVWRPGDEDEVVRVLGGAD